MTKTPSSRSRNKTLDNALIWPAKHDGIFVRWSQLLLDFLADFVLGGLERVSYNLCTCQDN